MTSRARHLLPLALRCATIALPVLAFAAPAPHEPALEKFLAAFAPADGGPIALSPDGRHVAYALREQGAPC